MKKMTRQTAIKGLVINSNKSPHRKTTGRQKYIEYDYEELFDQSVEDWDEFFVEQLLQTGKARRIYATR